MIQRMLKTGLLKRVMITLTLMAALPAIGLLITYEVIKVDWISTMEVQASFRPMEAPLPVPEGSIPIEGVAYVAGEGAPENPVAADSASLERGKLLYDINCALCHGVIGQGNGQVAEKLRRQPADLTGANVTTLSDGDIFIIITDGVQNLMPALRENLDVRDRWDVVNYVRRLGR